MTDAEKTLVAEILDILAQLRTKINALKGESEKEEEPETEEPKTEE